jgi:hypothetical protein
MHKVMHKIGIVIEVDSSRRSRLRAVHLDSTRAPRGPRGPSTSTVLPVLKY